MDCFPEISRINICRLSSWSLEDWCRFLHYKHSVFPRLVKRMCHVVFFLAITSSSQWCGFQLSWGGAWLLCCHPTKASSSWLGCCQQAEGSFPWVSPLPLLQFLHNWQPTSCPLLPPPSSWLQLGSKFGQEFCAMHIFDLGRRVQNYLRCGPKLPRVAQYWFSEDGPSL